MCIVYIAEAHASDEWPIGDRVKVESQARTTSDRAALARRSKDELGLSDTFRILIDPPELGDRFCNEYGAWPIRFYVFDRITGKLVHLGAPDGCRYDMEKPFEVVLGL